MYCYLLYRVFTTYLRYTQSWAHRRYPDTNFPILVPIRRYSDTSIKLLILARQYSGRYYRVSYIGDVSNIADIAIPIIAAVIIGDI